MNIFYLDSDPKICAENHCDKHIVKMIVEYSQLLSTAHRVLDGEGSKLLLEGETLEDGKISLIERKCYLPTHKNHPSAIWARECTSNYKWLLELLKWCHFQYSKRYCRVHKSMEIFPYLEKYPTNLKIGHLSKIPLAMPDEFKVEDEIQSYKNYYVGAKAKMAKWSFTETPNWFKGK